MTYEDLSKEIRLNSYKNFSIGLQYDKNIFDPLLNQSSYDFYVNLLHNCTEIVVYNYETNGFGKERMFGGKTLEYFSDEIELRYSLLDKKKPKLNSYNYYETKVDLSVLKIRGSS